MPYAPDRDIVNIYPFIARQATYALHDTAWEEWLGKFFTDANVTVDDLTEASACLARFMNITTDTAIDSVMDCLEKSGFTNLKPPAQVAMLMRIGQVTTASYWSMCRDAMAQNEKPPRVEDYETAINEINGMLKSPEIPTNSSTNCTSRCCH